MSIVKFSVLSYYPSFITNENVNIGILFELPDESNASFVYLKKWDRISSFDDELDISFLKDYLKGISYEVSANLQNYQKKFNLEDYVRYYVNEYKFSKVQIVKTQYPEKFIEETKKVYLRFDFDKTERLTKKQEYRYISKLLRVNNISFNRDKLSGYFNESIKYDYIIGDYAIKLFTFEGKQLDLLISTAKHWAFNALELKNKYKTIFIYDKEMNGTEYFEIIIKILESNAYRIFSFSEGMDFITSLSGEQLIKKDSSAKHEHMFL